MHLEADISKLYADTGWLPKVSFEEGIERVIEFEREKTESQMKVIILAGGVAKYPYRGR